MLSLRSNRVVLSGETRSATIRYEDGVVVEIGQGPAEADYGDLVVLPGLVDSHVHVNEPGRTDWEGFSTATRAAVAGGTTTIVDMPLNSIPPTVDVAALAAKRVSAAGRLSCDVAFWGGLIPGSEPHLAPLVSQGVCGFKSFLVDSGVPEYPSMTLEALESALSTLAGLGVPALIHAEDGSAIHPVTGDPRAYVSYLESRPPESEARAVSQCADLAAETGAFVHVLHLSSGDGVEALNAGPPELSGETCPHYLTFSSDQIPDGATPFKCAPPIRDSSHREALWEGLASGSLPMVVSDHSPAPADVKAIDTGDFAAAWGGIASLQLRLLATWTGAHTRAMGVELLAGWLASEPARLAGLEDRKGNISIGADADFVVFDPDGASVVRGTALEHRHPLTPYEGMTLRGEVVTTILRGHTVYERSSGVTGLRGRTMRRND